VEIPREGDCGVRSKPRDRSPGPDRRLRSETRPQRGTWGSGRIVLTATDFCSQGGRPDGERDRNDVQTPAPAGFASLRKCERSAKFREIWFPSDRARLRAPGGPAGPAGPVTRRFSQPSEDPRGSSGVDPSLRHPPAVVSGPRPLTPPTHSAKPLRQLTPPSHSANPLRQPTPPTHSANPLRQPTPPARHRQHQSASPLRQLDSAKPETANSKSANPSAPSHYSCGSFLKSRCLLLGSLSSGDELRLRMLGP
jgi:hypothetical protein